MSNDNSNKNRSSIRYKSSSKTLEESKLHYLERLS